MIFPKCFYSSSLISYKREFTGVISLNSGVTSIISEISDFYFLVCLGMGFGDLQDLDAWNLGLCFLPP